MDFKIIWQINQQWVTRDQVYSVVSLPFLTINRQSLHVNSNSGDMAMKFIQISLDVRMMLNHFYKPVHLCYLLF